LKQLVLSTFSIFIFSFTGSTLLAANTKFESTVSTPTVKQVVYKNSSLYLHNFQGTGTVEIYTIIGNKVAEFQQKDLYKAQYSVMLQSGNLYIVRVITSAGKIFTFKVLVP
jgi:hypothetical protein